MPSTELAAKHENEFVLVRMADTEEAIIRRIIRASGIQGTNPDLGDALEALASSNKTLILDEAHIVFSLPSLTFNLFKAPESWDKPPKILLFSAASEGEDGQGAPIAARAAIRKKYMWYPPMPGAEILSANLAAAEVYLNPGSVDFFMKICSGHRGIFMNAMEWVQQLQEGNKTSWDIHESVSRVKSSFTRSKMQSEDGWQSGLRNCMKQNRAVRVNGRFSDITKIPTEFAEVVFGGAKKEN